MGLRLHGSPHLYWPFMDATMPTGICKLCLQNKDLRNSHLVPAAMYKYARSPEAENPTTVRVDRRGAKPIARQVADYVLCADCEQRFNRYGENWMMKQVWNGRSFPLGARLNLALPHQTFTNFVAFSGAATGVDTDSLGYFAISVFWRAAVHTWKTSSYSAATPIVLGEFEEPIRRYLLGEAGFPSDVALLTTVCTDPYSVKVFYMPAPAIFPIPITAFAMLALGVQFLFFTGKVAPTQVCCVRSPGRLVFQRDCRQKTFEAYTNLFK
jgi:hypothetical protein